MILGPKRLYLFFAFFVALTIACSLFGGSDETKSEPSSSKDSKYLGEEYPSESGGFSIQKVKEYKFNDELGIVNMIAPGGNEESGPGIMVMGGLMEEDMSNDDVIGKIKENSSTLEILKEKSIMVGGVKGYSVETEGIFEDVSVKGKIVVAMVTPRQEFILIGIAPEDQWKEVSPIFDAVLGSVKFFDPVPEAANSSLPEEDLPEAPDTGSTSPGEEDLQPETKPGEIRQWAISARASSEYGSQDWSAKQATGEPNVEVCGDNVNAWASRGSNTVEWIELTFATPVYPTEINIFQTYNPSQVVEVQMIGTNGSKITAWDGYPEIVDFCPDQMSITDINAKVKINKIRITIDQRELDLGWNEIDAVELVGVTDESQSSAPQKPASSQADDSAVNTGGTVPTNYTGWMAEKAYQGYVKIEIEKTIQKELDGLIGMKGKKSTENWKPRPDHKDTYIYDFGDGMNAYVGVLTDGKVYKKSITPNKYPKDFKLGTVTKANYDKLDAIFKKDKVIPYVVMANMLKSPGFIRESYIADGKLKTLYEWYSSDGYVMSGFFLDGKLTGMAGLVYRPQD